MLSYDQSLLKSPDEASSQMQGEFRVEQWSPSITVTFCATDKILSIS